MLFFSLVTGMVVASMQVRFTGFNVAVPSDSWLVLVRPESTVPENLTSPVGSDQMDTPS